jgi:addiction module HigA family antidote
MDNIKIKVGEILKEEFLEPLGVSQYKLARDIGVSQTLVSKIVRGKTALTADIAVRLSRYFGTTAEFWLNMQNICDIRAAEEKLEANNIYITAFAPVAC